MTLQKKIARSVGKNLSFYLTGSILTAITIMLLVGAFAVSHSIYECFTPYFDETRVEDASFVTMTEIPEEEREALEKAYDVTLERQQYTDLDYDGTRLRLFAATEKLDLYTVSEGRKIEAADDIVVSLRESQSHRSGRYAASGRTGLSGVRTWHEAGLCDHALRSFGECG